jgi:Cu-Zn family superoxide dismutase
MKRIRTRVLAGLLASSVALSSGMAIAQEASPDASPAASPVTEGGIREVSISNPDGKIVAYTDITEGADGVTFTIRSVVPGILEPGLHGIHIHEVGSCDATGTEPYASAGGHFNPDDHSHGAPDDSDSHAGDLGNIEVGDDGTFTYEVTTDKVTLEPGQPNSLDDADGSAIVIHAREDDLATDPSGESGGRVACGTIFPSVEHALRATPPTNEDASATPAS